MHRRYHILFALLLYLFSLNAWSQVDRFEELFIWKMSEALRLDAKKESEFSAIIKEMNQEKADHLKKLNEITSEMAAVSKEKKAEELTSQYKTRLKAYQDVNLKEIEKLQEIFNPKRLAKYLSYKSEVLKKLQLRLQRPNKGKE